MTSQEITRRRKIVENLVDSICKIYEDEDQVPVKDSEKQQAQEPVGEAVAGKSKIKAVLFSFDPNDDAEQAVDVSKFRSVGEFLDQLRAFSKKVAAEGYYESLQVDFEQFNEFGDEEDGESDDYANTVVFTPVEG